MYYLVKRVVIIRKFFRDVYNKGNFKDYFKRNKLFFIISICLVLLSFYTGFNHSNVNTGFLSFVNSSLNLYMFLPGDITGSFVVIFVKNFVYSLYTMLLGLSFSVLSILFVVANEVGIGNVPSVISLIHMVNDVFVLVGSLLVAKIEVRFILEVSSLSWRSIASRIKVPFKDLILTVTIILVVVLIIALVKSVVFV